MYYLVFRQHLDSASWAFSRKQPRTYAEFYLNHITEGLWSLHPGTLGDVDLYTPMYTGFPKSLAPPVISYLFTDSKTDAQADSLGVQDTLVYKPKLIYC